MKKFSVNFEGRVNNFQLPLTKPLLPLFEAIVNAINAIDERRKISENFCGRISIQILRDGLQTFDELEQNGEKVSPITGFIIKDNGCGFNEENMQSFLQSDSSHKVDIGGKGIGRFTWLKAFRSIKIKSIYNENGNWKQRYFEFNVSNEGIDDHLSNKSWNEGETIEFETTVTLADYKAEFTRYLPKGNDDFLKVINQVIQHCIVYFLDENCPQIIVLDGGHVENLNDIFKKTYKTSQNLTKFEVKEQFFTILHVKIDSDIYDKDLSNKFLLCANSRQVISRKIDKLIPDLNKAFYTKYHYSYLGIIRGDYLDDKVSPTRDSFEIPENKSNEDDESEALIDLITIQEILQIAADKVRLFLQDALNTVSEEKIKQITNYIHKKAPRYTTLLKYAPKEISKIKAGITDDNLDDELNKIKRIFDEVNERKLKDLFKNRNKYLVNREDYLKELNNLLITITDTNKSELAQYVAKRRIILNCFKHELEIDENDKYRKESEIHNLLYPMKETSLSTEYEAHNLWLIDERLAYYSYIASDEGLDSVGGNRPDLIFLDAPSAFTDEDTMESISSIVIIELKRPMRNDYSSRENPIDQMFKYVKQIRSGKAKLKNGRKINASRDTRFYLYAICDITSTLIDIMEERDYNEMPDGKGYYGFNQKLNSYIEVLSFDKIYLDAMKRNKILFRKLGVE